MLWTITMTIRNIELEGMLSIQEYIVPHKIFLRSITDGWMDYG